MDEFHNTTGEITMYNPDKECEAMIEALKKLCQQKNMTPYAVAKEAGISSSTVSYIMNGRTKPQMYTVLLMCNVLGVTISQLFEESAGTSGTEPESACGDGAEKLGTESESACGVGAEKQETEPESACGDGAEKQGTEPESACGKITGEEEELLKICRSFSEKKKELLRIYMNTLQQL